MYWAILASTRVTLKAGVPTARHGSGENLRRVAGLGAELDLSNRRALDGRKVELDSRRVVGMLSRKLSLDLDRSGEQRRIRRRSERR